MRDIVYRPTQSSRSRTRFEPVELPPLEVKQHFFERLFHAGNLFLGTISQLGDPATPQKVIHRKKPKVRPAPTTKAQRTPRKPITRHLKTPHGKVATVNALLLAGVVGYVAQVTGHLPTSPERSNEPETTSSTLRQYLPNPRSLENVQAFRESELLEDQKRIPLYSWLTPWNTDAITDAMVQSKSISAFWLSVDPGGATFSPKADWSRWQEVRGKLGEKDHVYITVSGDPDDVFTALTNSEVQQQHIEKLLAIVQEQGFNGVDLDYEGLGIANRDYFTAFVKKLTTTFHEANKQVAVTLESRLANQVPMDWYAIGTIADEVRIMAYDYHGQTTGFPGPIAPIGWVKEVLDYAVQQIPPDKIVLGLGNYGYDWIQDGDTWKGSGISFEKAVSQSKEVSSPIVQASGIDERGYDIGTTPTYSYLDEAQTQHVVWFEDKSSLDTKVNLAKQYPIRGIIFWSVGLGDQAFWAQHSNQGGQ